MSVEWLAAIGMMLAGLIVGFMFVYSMRRRDVKVDTELRDLEARRDTLLAALRELHDTGGPADERTRLEREAAEVLKAIDAHAKPRKKGQQPVAAPPPAAAPAPAPIPVSATRATMKGFAWGALTFGVLGGIFWFVTQSAKPKADEAPAMTPPMSQAPTQSEPPADPAVRTLEESVKKNPNDLAQRTELAKLYLDGGKAMAAFEQTQYVLARAPKDPKALTYQAVVRIAMGEADQARQMLETAAAADPDLIDASAMLAWTYVIAGRDADAQRVIDEATKRHPAEKQRLDGMLAEMRAKQKNIPAAPAQKHPTVPTAAPAAAAGPSIHVSVTLAPNVKVPANAVIWVMARPDGTAGGPPLAVKRATPSSAPIEVDLSAADSMMGAGTLPEKMRIEARLDMDGDPMTHDPHDPIAFQDGVGVGAKVALTLK